MLIVLEPWHKIFFRNFADLFRPEEKALLQVVSRPADFWPDVFVATPLPWRRFAQSSFTHIVVIAAFYGWVRATPLETLGDEWPGALRWFFGQWQLGAPEPSPAASRQNDAAGSARRPAKRRRR